MKETSWYKCTIRVEYEDLKGRVKYRKEVYLISAISTVDAQTKMATYMHNANDYEIVSVSVINIADVIAE